MANKKHKEGGFIDKRNDIGTKRGRPAKKVVDKFDKVDFGLPPSYRGKQK